MNGTFWAEIEVCERGGARKELGVDVVFSASARDQVAVLEIAGQDTCRGRKTNIRT
jgi:hypothetical protein